LLFTGNELLIGKTLNTNGNWLAKEITAIGGEVSRMYTIKDDLNEIKEILKYILSRKPDFLIISGGLGPTFDDKTLQGVALALNIPLELNKEALKSIEEKYHEIFKKGVSKTDEIIKSRRKMALLPKNAVPLPNPVGTAPGVMLKTGDTTIFCLPGVPAELKAIFKESVLPYLKKINRNIKFYEKTIKTEGIVESELAEHIEKIMCEIPSIYIKTHPQGYEGTSRVNIHITAFGDEKRSDNLNKAVKKIEGIIHKMGGKIIR